MKASEILSKIKAENISLWVENGRLKFRAPKDAFPDDGLPSAEMAPVAGSGGS